PAVVTGMYPVFSAMYFSPVSGAVTYFTKAAVASYSSGVLPSMIHSEAPPTIELVRLPSSRAGSIATSQFRPSVLVEPTTPWLAMELVVDAQVPSAKDWIRFLPTWLVWIWA